jgi:hypothetical protein
MTGSHLANIFFGDVHWAENPWKNCSCFSIITQCVTHRSSCLLSGGCHLGPDEAGGRVPIPGGPAELVDTFLEQACSCDKAEPGRVAHPVRILTLNFWKAIYAILRQWDYLCRGDEQFVFWYCALCCRNAQTRELSHLLPVMQAHEVVNEPGL